MSKPFEYLKNTLLGQFGKSIWQSYFELLRLPMELQGLKPSVLMGKLKQHLPPAVFPDNDLFLAMFLVRLPPSMHETVGAGNNITAAAMVKAADTLWDARSGHNPTVAAATTQQSRSPASNSRRRGNKRGSNTRFKSHPPLLPRFLFISEPWQWHVQNFTITTPIEFTGVLHPVLCRKTSLLPNHFWFGGQSSTCHCHGNAFPSQCRSHFSHRRTKQIIGIWLILEQL
jgi:hypothetical protein